MARFDTTIASPLSPEEAFARMAAFERVPEWDPNTSAARRVGDTVGTGAEFDITTTFGRRSMDVRYRMTEYEPYRRLVLEAALPNGMGLRDEVTVVSTDRGLSVTYDARILPTGIWRLADPFLQIIFTRVGRRAVEPLRRYLSEPSPPRS